MKSQRRAGLTRLALLALVLCLPAAALAHHGADETALVSRASGQPGAAAVGDSYGRLSVSADGRFIAFVSDADNLSSDANPSVANVFVYDVETHETALASRASEPVGAGGDGYSAAPAMSPDGRYVAFKSKADNLSDEDNDSVTNVFVRDLVAGTTTLASRADGVAGAAADGSSLSPSISADGRAVAFKSVADNLSSDADPALWNVFVRDTESGTTTLVSRGNPVRAAPLGVPADGDSFSPTISASGLRVAFASTADSLSTRDNDAVTNVFVKDLVDKSTRQVSCTDGGFLAFCPSGADGDSTQPVLSQGGRFVAFVSEADNLSSEDDDAQANVFLRDLEAGTTMLVSRAIGPAGAGAAADSTSPALSADGRFVAFVSGAENLSDQDAATFDVFVRDTANSVTGLASRATGAAGPPAAGSSFAPAVSGNGLKLAFASEADNLSAEDEDSYTNVFLRDISSFGAPPPPPVIEPPACGHHGGCEPTPDGAGHGADHGASGHAGAAAGGHAGHTAAPGKGPGQTVVARRTQDVDKLFIMAVIHQNGTIDVTGTVRLGPGSAKLYRFKPVKRKLKAHLLKRIELALPAKARRAVKHVLRTGRGVNARLTVKATNAAGASTRVRRVVRLRP